MIDITTPGATVTNAALVTGNPAVRIRAANVRFINENGGEVRGVGTGSAALFLDDAASGSTIVNEAGGRIVAATFDSLAIRGSNGGDFVDNAGSITGAVELRDGDDRVTLIGPATTESLSLGDGADTLVLRPTQVSNNSYYLRSLDGGAGTDVLRVELGAAQSLSLQTGTVTGIERVEFVPGTADFAFVGTFGLDGVGEIVAPSGNTVLRPSGDLRNARITLTGGRLELYNGATVGRVDGTAGRDDLTIGDGVLTGTIDLGAGDDTVSLQFGGNNTVVQLGGDVIGGAGFDTVYGFFGPGKTFALDRLIGFETFSYFGSTFNPTDPATPVTLTGLRAGMVLTLGTFFGSNAIPLILAGTSDTQAQVRVGGGTSVELAADSVVGSIGDLTSTMPSFQTLAQTVIVRGVAGTVGFGFNDDTLALAGRVDTLVTFGPGADRLVQLALAASIGSAADLGAGDDRVELLAGGPAALAPLLDGGAGSDTVAFTQSAAGVIVDLIAQSTWDGVHNERLAGFENATGSPLADILTGDGGANRLQGLAGDDRIAGQGGADLLLGGDGDDRLEPGDGVDALDGGAGLDTLDLRDVARSVIVDFTAGLAWDGVDLDTMSGVEGAIGTRFDDSFFGGPEDNVVDGGAGGADTIALFGGADTVVYALSATAVIIDLVAQLSWDGAVNDRLVGVENATGSAFADAIFGDAAGNRLDGGTAGADYLAGFGGEDTVVYRSSGAGVIVDLTAQASWDGAVNDRLVGVESAEGSRFADALYGDGGFNLLAGGAGDDLLRGLGGADRMEGGAGADVFVLGRFEAAGDVIADFASGVDRLRLIGWNAGTTVLNVGGDLWRITDGLDGYSETLAIAGTVAPTDLLFG